MHFFFQTHQFGHPNVKFEGYPWCQPTPPTLVQWQQRLGKAIAGAGRRKCKKGRVKKSPLVACSKHEPKLRHAFYGFFFDAQEIHHVQNHYSKSTFHHSKNTVFMIQHVLIFQKIARILARFSTRRDVFVGYIFPSHLRHPSPPWLARQHHAAVWVRGASSPWPRLKVGRRINGDTLPETKGLAPENGW